MADDRTTREPNRPSPAALLKLAAQETRGKLKVFLGAAPGVGKTYAMLSAGAAVLKGGTDVVVGVVETHGRSETAALLDGLEILPRKPMTYRGRTLLEFDLEAALARKPQLMLVDEFAHSNAPGSLHTKRYRDVEELLRAGIDVWTTLNIQHVESLTDVVEKITGVAVRETVPDKVIERADDIVVVDLPPEELIKRLKEGKVYLPDNARRAVDRFFKAGNLTALRELALRRTADRVDEQMLEHLRQNAIEGAWPTAERLLVCVGSDERSEMLVRTAARIAAAIKAPWTAVHLYAVELDTLDRSTRRRAEKALRLAERLGADSVRLSGRDLVAEVMRYASRNNVTQLVLGRSSAGLWRRLRGRSLTDQILVQAKGMAVTVIAPDAAPASANWTWRWPQVPEMVLAVGTAALAVTGAVIAGRLLANITPLPNVAILFLMAVLVCALRQGTLSALSASFLSFLAYNYFFIEPIYTFTVTEPYELVSLLVFLAVSAFAGGLAGRLRDQSQAIRERAEAVRAMYDVSRKLSAAPKLDDVIWIIANSAAQSVRGHAVLLLRDGPDLALSGAWPPEDQIGTSDWAAARWAFKERESAGRFTGTMPTARFHFKPISGAGATLGVLGVEPTDSAEPLADSVDAALQALIDQAAVAIERTYLVEKSARAEAEAESERLRAAMLSAVSHDLRTPLASILGSVTSLRALGDKMSAEDRRDLLATIEEEATRLTRFVANMLDMTRIEAGVIDVRKEEVAVGEMLRAAVDRASKLLRRRKSKLIVDSNLPLILGDAAVLEQIMFNLLDNADKYSGSASVTEVAARARPDGVAITVTDHGAGIAADALPHIFDKFYRANPGDGRPPGTGLGLSICKGLVEAMGGHIAAQSPVAAGRGTRITLTFPGAPKRRGSGLTDEAEA